jgi:putative spermidine/putrescine transport system permease protein
VNPRPSTALVMPAVAWLAVAWAWPLMLVFAMSIRHVDPTTFVVEGWTLGHFRSVLLDPFYVDALFRSLRIAALVTVLAAVLGYPVALHISRTKSQQARAVFTLILLIPIMISLVVTAFAWILILGPTGLANQVIQFFRLSSGPIQLLNSEAGVVAVLVYSFGPYLVLNICTSIDKIDPAVLRAAEVHGASRWQQFYRIILPLSVPGILSGGLIVFSLAAAAFVTPYVIGGSRVKVLPLLIYNAAVTTFDWPLAATLSILLFIICIILTAFVARMTEQRFAAWLRGT